MPRIEGGETYLRGHKVTGVSDAEMDDVKLLINAGVGREGPMSDEAIAAVLSLQRPNASKVARYNALLDTMADARASNNPWIKREWLGANRAYLNAATKASPSISQVHTDSALANMSTQYANEEFIGEMLMPPVVVAKKSDTYYTYGKRDRLASPTEDVIAEDGEAPDVVESRSTGSYACVDRGNKRGVAANTVANQDAPLDELADLTTSLLDHRGLRRELRISTAVTTNTNYNASNRATLSGAQQWNAAGGGSPGPIANIQTGLATMWRGLSPAQTKSFCSLDIYNVLSRHEDFLGLFQYSGTAIGLATPAMIAGFLGMDALLIGAARYDSTPLAATATYSRMYGDFFGILRVAQRQTIRSATFGMTMRWGMAGVPGANSGILSQQWFDMTKGLGGTHFAKVGESEAHEIQCDDCGYIIIDTLA